MESFKSAFPSSDWVTDQKLHVKPHKFPFDSPRIQCNLLYRPFNVKTDKRHVECGGKELSTLSTQVLYLTLKYFPFHATLYFSSTIFWSELHLFTYTYTYLFASAWDLMVGPDTVKQDDTEHGLKKQILHFKSILKDCLWDFIWVFCPLCTTVLLHDCSVWLSSCSLRRDLLSFVFLISPCSAWMPCCRRSHRNWGGRGELVLKDSGDMSSLIISS